jgi:hypothetical protein
VDSSGLWPQCLPEGVYVKGKTEIQYVGGEGGGGGEKGEKGGREREKGGEKDETTMKR